MTPTPEQIAGLTIDKIAELSALLKPHHDVLVNEPDLGRVDVSKDELSALLHLAAQALRAEQEKPLPDSAGWWWRWSAVNSEWTMTRIEQAGDGSFYVVDAWFEIKAGLWIKAQSPSDWRQTLREVRHD